MEALLGGATTNKYMYIVNALRKELAREIRAKASDEVNSVLQSQNPEDLKQFSWDMLLNELSTQLKRLLSLAAKTKIARSNTNAVVGMCAALLIKHCNPKMNLVQKIKHAHWSYFQMQVYQRLTSKVERRSISHISYQVVGYCWQRI